MADTVKNVAVRLSFEHGDTKSQIAAIRNELKLLDTGFQASAMNAAGMSNAMNAAGSRAQMLAQQVQLQQQAVDKYGSAIQAAQQRVDALAKKHEQYGQSLEKAKAQHESLTAQIEAVKKAMADTDQTTAEGAAAYKALEEQLKALEEEEKKAAKEVEGYEKALKKTDQQINNADRGVQKLKIAQNEANAALGKMRQELEQANQGLKKHGEHLQQAAQKTKQFADASKATGQAQERVGRTLSKVSTGIVTAGAASAGAAIQWESSMAGVRQVVHGTDEQLQQLEAGLLEMSKTKPVDNTTLAQIAADAGQLGIATDNVLEFTGIMADLAASTNLSASEGASAFAKFANVTQMPQENFANLASSVTYLGNNLATTQADIMEMAMRLGAAGAQVGMTTPQIIGMAGALSSLGLEAQAGGTAFSKLFVNMKVAAETGSEDLEKFANVAGMSATAFADMFNKDAAGAITAFIQGLANGSDSAIVMLDEMGISEVRFRDALLRTTNATELFSQAMDDSTRAWGENTALADAAGAKYNTTQAQMTMLGNSAKAMAIGFGQELLPTIQSGIDWVGGLIEKFSALDSGTKKGILTWGAYAAAVGPAIGILGKLNTGIGAVAGGLGNLMSAAASAGGGFSGLMSAIGGMLGPAGIAALIAGAGLLIYKFADWASGAKAAREATEALNKQAQDWLSTQAKTLYDTGTADPLSRFGLSASDFSANGGVEAAEDWLQSLITVWTDGKGETDEIVKSFVDGFTSGSDDVRDAITAQRDMLDGYGALTPEMQATMDDDLAQLDAWDQEVADLLKKRKNGFLTDEEQARLQELIDKRGEIEVKYSMDTDNGYDQIVTGMRAALERGDKVGYSDPTLIGDTLTALANGRKAYNDSLDESYDKEYATIQAIQDETARQTALDALNEKYQSRRAQGEEEYRQALSEVASEAGRELDYGGTVGGIYQVAEALGDLENVDIEDIKNITEGWDEAQLAGMLTLIEQLRDSGMSNTDIEETLGLDKGQVDGLYNTLTQIRDIANGTEGLDGLGKLVGEALPDEIQRLAVGLDLTQAAADWEAFANGGSLKLSPTMDTSTIDLTALESLTGTVTAIHQGASVTVDLSTLDALNGTVTVIDDAGNRTTVSISSLEGLTGTVTAVTQGQNVTVDLSTLDALNGTVTVINDAGEATTVSLAALSGLSGTVTGIYEGSAVTVDLGTLDALNGTVTVISDDGTKTTVSLASLTGLTGTVTGYQEGETVTFDATKLSQLDGTVTSITLGDGVAPTVPVSITLNALDKAALDAWKATNGDAIELAAKVNVAFGPTWQTDLKTAWDEGKLSVWSADGEKITVTPEVLNQITANDLVVFDDDGTVHVIITPEVGSEEGVQKSGEAMENTSQWSGGLDFLGDDAQDKIDRANKIASELERVKQAKQDLHDSGEIFDDSGLSEGDYQTQINDLESSLIDLGTTFTDTDIESIGSHVANLMAALNSGDLDPETAKQYATELQNIFTALDTLDTTTTGSDVVEGIASGMLAYNFTGDGEALKSAILNAINGPLQINSPSKAMEPTGSSIAEGIAKGATGYNYRSMGNATASAIVSAFSGLSASGRTIGTNFGRGLYNGLNSQMSQTVKLAQLYAEKIKQAFKNAWQINSPSKVAEGLTMNFGRGLEKGMAHWPSVSEAVLERDLNNLYGGMRQAQAATVNRTTNANNSVNLNVGSLEVKDTRDAETLAREIAAVGARRNRGLGYR